MDDFKQVRCHFLDQWSTDWVGGFDRKDYVSMFGLQKKSNNSSHNSWQTGSVSFWNDYLDAWVPMSIFCFVLGSQGSCLYQAWHFNIVYLGRCLQVSNCFKPPMNRNECRKSLKVCLIFTRFPKVPDPRITTKRSASHGKNEEFQVLKQMFKFQRHALTDEGHEVVMHSLWKEYREVANDDSTESHVDIKTSNMNDSSSPGGWVEALKNFWSNGCLILPISMRPHWLFFDVCSRPS